MPNYDPILRVSEDNKQWTTSVQIPGERLLSLYYKLIVKNANDQTMRMAFPVHSDEDTSIPASISLMTRKDWNNTELAVTAPRSVKPIRLSSYAGVYDFQISTNDEIEILFKLRLRKEDTPLDVATYKLSIAECRLSVGTDSEDEGLSFRDSDQLLTIKLAANTQKPFVAKFAASKPLIIDGESTMLKWDVSNAEGIAIFKESSGQGYKVYPEDAKFSAQLNGEFKTLKLNHDTKYTLRRFMDGGIEFTEGEPDEVNVRVFGKSTAAGRKNLFDGQKLMGVYPYGEKLYALVLHENLEPRNVLIWESYNGLTWTRADQYSHVPAFISSANTDNVPLRFAHSSALVFDERLYLIGGSRCDTNIRTNDIYFYDFADKQKGWQKDQSAPFSARSGICCLAAADGMWVLGGLTDEGVSDEVWFYKKGTWEKDKEPLPQKRYMLSAVFFNNEIQIYGGIKDSDGESTAVGFEDSYRYNTRWEKINVAQFKDTYQYLASSVAVCKGKVLLFTVTDKAGYKYNVKTISDKNTGESLKDTGIQFLADKFYQIQSVSFRDVIWLCAASYNGEDEQGYDVIDTMDLNYFIYYNNSMI